MSYDDVKNLILQELLIRNLPQEKTSKYLGIEKIIVIDHKKMRQQLTENCAKLQNHFLKKRLNPTKKN